MEWIVNRQLRVPKTLLNKQHLVFTGAVAGVNFPDILWDDELSSDCFRKI